MPRLPEFIRSFFSKVRNSGFFRWVLESQGVLRGRLKEKTDKLLARIPAERRIIMTLVIGVPVILLLFIIGASRLSKDRPVKPKALPAGNVITRRIPAEELFLPDEPDFVPDVILGREKRTQWTADDAKPWWQDPLKDGEQEWRDQIEKTVDEIMEKVP